MAAFNPNVTSAIASTIDTSGMLSNIPGVDLLVKILQAVGIVFLIYLVFQIIRAITGINTSRRLKRIANGVESIDKKLDVLIGKRKK